MFDLVIPENIKAAIDLYFDTKEKGNGLFLVPGQKQEILDKIGVELEKHNLSGWVVPGIIQINWNYTFTEFNPETMKDEEKEVNIVTIHKENKRNGFIYAVNGVLVNAMFNKFFCQER